jgi:flagellar motility protein MotE (MotC chaperone)
MKLRIKKSLVRGEYQISLQTIGFKDEEMEKINKFGSPIIDFSTDGLGHQDVEKLDVFFKGENQNEAEEMLSRIENQIKEKMNELLQRADGFSGEEVMEI